MSQPDLVLRHLLDRHTGSDDAGDTLSEQIHHRLRQLGEPVRGLRLRWFRDASQPTGTPILMAHPQSYGGRSAENQFAQAVTALSDGKYDSYTTDPDGHTVFEATTLLGGVGTVIEYLVWRYDDPEGVAKRLPALIRQHQR